MFKMYVDYFRALMGNRKGQGMVEYGLLIGLIAVGLIVVLTAFRDQLGNTFTNVVNSLTQAQGAGGGGGN